MTGSSASAARVTAVLGMYSHLYFEIIVKFLIAFATISAVNVLRIIDTNSSLFASYHERIAEVDVAVFLKAVITESLEMNSRSLMRAS